MLHFHSKPNGSFTNSLDNIIFQWKQDIYHLWHFEKKNVLAPVWLYDAVTLYCDQASDCIALKQIGNTNKTQIDRGKLLNY